MYVFYISLNIFSQREYQFFFNYAEHIHYIIYKLAFIVRKLHQIAVSSIK